MARIKVTSDSSFYVGNGWTNWQTNHEYEYSNGECVTPKGIISLYIQEDAANARIAHKGRCYTIYYKGKLTKLGLVRLAKRWAINIWETK